MSGVELLIMAGGVAVPAAAAAVGLHTEHARDQRDLASHREVETLYDDLRKAHVDVASAHRALAEAWGGPLSLFDERAEVAANKAGVPAWAIACVFKAQRLVNEAAELGDRADVYEAQFAVAKESDTGLLRRPVIEHVEQLEELSQRLAAHLPCIEKAAKAFASPSRLSDDDRDEEIDSPLGHTFSRDSVASSPGNATEAPMGILRDRSRWGQAYKSMRYSGKKAVTAAKSEMEDVWMKFAVEDAWPLMKDAYNNTRALVHKTVMS